MKRWIENMKRDFNFVIFGDSITKGVIYDEQKKHYVISNNNFCNIIKPKVSGVIYNAGKFGSTILRGARKLQSDVLTNNPDIVLLEFGGNDCNYNWEEVAKEPYKDHQPQTTLPVFAETFSNIIKTLKDLAITPVLLTLPPLDADKYLKWISNNNPQNEKNILTWLGSVNRIFSWQETYSKTVQNIAEETHTKVIDMRKFFLNTPNYKDYLCVDGIHPNVAGHELIANNLISYAKENYKYLLKSSDAITV